jgi:hypothetical protein
MLLNYNVEDVVIEIGIPIEEWDGNCHGIASAMVECGLVYGIVQRGHWLGFVHDYSTFAGRPVVPHSWIEIGKQIVDPTRFAFEYVDPYIWVGSIHDENYDAGGNQLREALMRPCPKFNPLAQTVQLVMDNVPAEYVAEWLEGNGSVNSKGLITSKEHCFWLANLPLQMLGLVAKPLFEALTDAGFKAAIPIDNYRNVMR